MLCTFLFLSFAQAAVMQDGQLGGSSAHQKPGWVSKLEDPAKAQGQAKQEFVPGEIVIKLKEGKTLDDIKDLNQKYGVVSTDKSFGEFLDAQKKQKASAKKSLTTKEHILWFWQLDKNSKDYKEYRERLAKEKEEEGKNKEQGQEADQEKPETRTTLNNLDLSSLENIYTLKTVNNVDTLKAVQEYKKNPAVEEASPNYIRKAQMVPNDPYYSARGTWGQDYDDLWGLKNIQAGQAWDFSQGEGTVVAVVDTGVDYTHEDMAANIWNNSGEAGLDDLGRSKTNNGLDDDSNGFIDDFRGWDFTLCYSIDYGYCNAKLEDNNPMDDFGHGTHVAGTIAAVGNNNKGIIGVSPKAKIMALKGLAGDGGGADSWLAKAIIYAALNGADVINMSFGGTGGVSVELDEAMRIAYTQGRGGKGCILVAAAGNSSADVQYFYPAGSPYVITVASIDHEDKRSDFSNYGVKVDVAAPGGESNFWHLGYSQYETDISKASILSLRFGDMFSGYPGYLNGDAFYPLQGDAGSKYYRALGTSMAAPHVAGLAALVIKEFPDATSKELMSRIKATTDSFPEDYLDIFLGGSILGAGRINAFKAVSSQRKPYLIIKNIRFEEEIGDGDLIPESGEKVKLIIKLANIWKDASSVKATLSTSSPNIYSIPVPVSDYGNMPQETSKENALQPFVFECTSVVFETPAVFELNINADGVMQKLRFKVTLGAKKINGADVGDRPVIVGDKVVWMGYTNHNWNIYAFDFQTNSLRQITNELRDQMYPFVYGNKIVWQGSRPNSVGSDIYLYDLQTNTKTKITDNSYGSIEATISGNKMTWTELNYDHIPSTARIYLYDLDTGLRNVLTPAAEHNYRSMVDGNRVVWTRYITADDLYDIRALDLDNNQEIKITDDPYIQYSPCISGDKAVWVDRRNGNSEIYLYNFTTGQTRRITVNGAAQFEPWIHGNRIVWMDQRDIQGNVFNDDIYLFDLTTNTEQRVTNNHSQQYYPSIYGKRIVWTDLEGGIYASDIPDATPPSIPVVTDQGQYTGNKNQLNGYWSSQDPESNIQEYQFRLLEGGTSGAVVVDWTSAGKNTSATVAPASPLKLGKKYYFAVKARNGQGIWSDVGYSDGITINNLPTVSSLSPACGLTAPGVAVDFSATYYDLDGCGNLATARFLINRTLTSASAVYVYYNQNSNKLYLISDDGKAWLGGYTPGTANIIENTYGRLDCSKTSVSGSGNVLTVKWNIIFKPAFSGTAVKNIYLYATDDYGANSGFVQKGTRLVGVNSAPTLGNLTPSYGSSAPGEAVIFNAIYSDPNGYQDLQIVRILINNALTSLNSAYVAYYQNTNKIYVVDTVVQNGVTKNVWIGGYSPGSRNIIRGKYVTVDCSRIPTPAGSGNNLTVKWNVTFTANFVGPLKKIYLYTTDDSGATSGFAQKGSWEVKALL